MALAARAASRLTLGRPLAKHNVDKRCLVPLRGARKSWRSCASGSNSDDGDVRYKQLDACFVNIPSWSLEELHGMKENGIEVSLEDVHRLGKLSHLDVADNDGGVRKERIRADLQQVLRFAETVKAAAEENTTVSVEEKGCTSFRDDVVAEDGMQDAVLMNAPRSLDGYFTVPHMQDWGEN